MQGQTMVLFETQGLQLYWLCEGAYGDSGDSVLDDSTQVLTHRLILALVPEHHGARIRERIHIMTAEVNGATTA